MDNHFKYWHFISEFTPEECKSIIDRGMSQLDLDKKNNISTRAITKGDSHLKASDDLIIPLNGKSVQQSKKENIDLSKSYVRDSEICWLNDQWIYDLILPKLIQANYSAGWKYDIDVVESMQFTIYKPGGFYGWHTDSGSDHIAKTRRHIHGLTDKNLSPVEMRKQSKNPKLIGRVRKLSLTINLNAPGDYEGGNLMFDYGNHTDQDRFYECTEIRPQGSMIVFPSYTYHCVTPITKGTRYSLVIWANGAPFK